MIFVVDANRGDGQRFIVRADEMLTAFVELESQLAVKGMAFSERACFRAFSRIYD